MQINHVQFFLDDAIAIRNQLIRALNCRRDASRLSFHTYTDLVASGNIYFLLSSPLTNQSPAADFLKSHPSGVVDIAFQVDDLAGIMKKAVRHGVRITQPLHRRQGIQWAQVQSWGNIHHTLIEMPHPNPSIPVSKDDNGLISPLCLVTDSSNHDIIMDQGLKSSPPSRPTYFTDIDHIVLNVPTGELTRAAQWYDTMFGLQPTQTFTIQTDYSALRSLVLKRGSVQIPINEPLSANSQIQEFLDVNCGAGIQHIALQTPTIIQAVQQLRSAKVPLITVPDTYYAQLQHKYPLQQDWGTIAAQGILVDWQDNIPALLLQIFTQPIFQQPTFFFEIIERQQYWQDNGYQSIQGFGERNFQALVAAIEQEQLNRCQLAQKATH